MRVVLAVVLCLGMVGCGDDGAAGRVTYGATDDLGYHAVENRATVLHQLGLDHEALTYRHGGRDFRLTDVHGNVLHEILS